MNEIKRRGRMSAQLSKKLENEWKQLIEFISSDPELDVQLRDNYISVYYDGGEIIKITPKELSIDKWYFYIPIHPEARKTFVEEVAKGKFRANRTYNYLRSAEDASRIIGATEEFRDETLNFLKRNDFDIYFHRTKEIMAKWVEYYKRYERKKQHIIACSNRNLSSHNNLVVIDIEFAVSRNKPYNSTQGKNGGKKVPKFDIITVDESGQLYAIELKDNLRADNDKSAQSVKAHKQDFNLTIGADTPENDFAQEMNEVLKMKQKLGLLPKSLKIDTSALPKFAIAYSGDKEEDYERFKAKHHDETIVNIVKQNGKLYLNLPK